MAIRYALLGLAPLLAWCQASTPQLTRAEIEQFLKTAKVIDTRQTSKGITRSLRAKLSDGKITHEAHIQSIDEFKTEFRSDRGSELNFKDTYKFNIAGYRLAAMLGIENVPVSVERRWAGRTSAFTWWVDDVMMDEITRRGKKVDPPDVDYWNRQMYTVRVFDQLIANTDRNLQNLLIQKNWDMWMIDHTRAFRIRRDLSAAENLTMCERGLLTKLRELDKASLGRELRPYLTSMELEALLARRDKIVALFDKAVKTRGAASVLYDMRK